MSGTRTDRIQEQGLDDLINSLPACRRCRSIKRRCDTLLPTCRNCFKASAECIFFDHVLNEDLPRSYIASLLEALNQTRLSARSIHNHDAHQPHNEAFQFVSAKATPKPIQSVQSTRYLGEQSLLCQSLAIVGTQQLPLQSEESTLFFLEELAENAALKPKMHQFLLQTYFSELQQLYPFLDSSLSFLNPQLPCSQELLPSESFILQMVYSIACQCVPDRGNRLLSLSDACYTRALKHIDSATANLTVETLQSIALLALRSLFDPQKGNFGQLIAFAARLAIDIGGQDIPAWGDSMRNIYTSIYCMESQFATVLDRPLFLPEPVRESIHSAVILTHLTAQQMRPIKFDISQPSEYFCSLYRIQAKYRRGNEVEARKFLGVLDIDDLERKVKINEQIPPNILCAVYETQLLLNSSSSAAATMLASYHHPRFMQTFLTPQWTYRAALIVLQQYHKGTIPEFDLMQVYGQSLVLLDRASLRWKGAVTLSQSLRLMGQHNPARSH